MNTSPPRAWHKKHKKMRDVCLLLWAKDGRMCVGTNKPYSELDDVKGYYHGKDVVLLWPTGLQDKNGTEAYGSKEHGDVIRYFDYIGVIKWSDSKLAWIVEWVGDEPHPDVGGDTLGSLSRADTEIIGNSLQHPGLLSDGPSGKKESP